MKNIRFAICALFAGLTLILCIPPELYGAVADVLVYLYRMNGTL